LRVVGLTNRDYFTSLVALCQGRGVKVKKTAAGAQKFFGGLGAAFQKSPHKNCGRSPQAKGCRRNAATITLSKIFFVPASAGCGNNDCCRYAAIRLLTRSDFAPCSCSLRKQGLKSLFLAPGLPDGNNYSHLAPVRTFRSNYTYRKVHDLRRFSLTVRRNKGSGGSPDNSLLPRVTLLNVGRKRLGIEEYSFRRFCIVPLFFYPFFS